MFYWIQEATSEIRGQLYIYEIAFGLEKDQDYTWGLPGTTKHSILGATPKPGECLDSSDRNSLSNTQ